MERSLECLFFRYMNKIPMKFFTIDPTFHAANYPMIDSFVNRRRFLQMSAALAGTAILPVSPAFAQTTLEVPVQRTTKYRRYNVMSKEGKQSLQSYAKGIEAMLNLPVDHPQNWFRNAFIHIMDCPHGNWWFLVWHRGYLGYFEQSIRNLSGDNSFAMPYWDWTTLPQIPESLFDGILTPQGGGFESYTRNFGVFSSRLKPVLNDYWNKLNAAQREQLNIRGYADFESLWNDVTGYSPKEEQGISGNMAFANTCGSRYLTRDNPKLDPKTAADVSARTISYALTPVYFYNEKILALSFSSSKTPSHNTPPGNGTHFSVLEGLPHNKVHNYIGGVGPLDLGPYGFMTNFLSPVDPVFFLHHANIDRLWDVWTRKQQSLDLPYLPQGQDLATLSNDPFLFFVDGNGKYVGNSVAGDYLSVAKFDYDYEPGFGENIISLSTAEPVQATLKDNTAFVVIPTTAIRKHLASATAPSLLAEVTIERSAKSSTTREFDVIVGAPPDVTSVTADSPYYAGTIAFFGSMSHMRDMPMRATFSVPLPNTRQVFGNLQARENVEVSIRVVPSQGGGNPPVLRELKVHLLR